MTTENPDQSNVRPLRTVTWAAEHGTRRDFLVALYDRLWSALHDERTQPRDLSPITLRLKELQAEIEAIDLRDDDVLPPDETWNPDSI